MLSEQSRLLLFCWRNEEQAVQYVRMPSGPLSLQTKMRKKFKKKKKKSEQKAYSSPNEDHEINRETHVLVYIVPHALPATYESVGPQPL